MHGTAIPQWYVVQTVPRFEAVIDRKLQAKRFTTFFPRERRMVMHRGIRRPIVEPLLPCYLFVQADFTRQAAERITEEDGVVRILGRRDTEGYYATDVSWIEARMAEGCGGVIDRDPPAEERARYLCGHEVGDTLYVQSGQWACIAGRFVSGDPYIVWLEICLLGHKTVVPVDHDRIQGAVLLVAPEPEPDATEVIKFRRDRRLARRMTTSQRNCGSMDGFAIA